MWGSVLLAVISENGRRDSIWYLFAFLLMVLPAFFVSSEDRHPWRMKFLIFAAIFTAWFADATIIGIVLLLLGNIYEGKTETMVLAVTGVTAAGMAVNYFVCKKYADVESLYPFDLVCAIRRILKNIREGKKNRK
jgi:small-conductance mechanosensitive channel